MNDDINQYIPSVLNPRSVRKAAGDSILLTQNSIISRCSLSLKRNGVKTLKKTFTQYKENPQCVANIQKIIATPKKSIKINEDVGGSLGFSAIEDLIEKFDRNSSRNITSSPLSFTDFYKEQNNNNKQEDIASKILKTNLTAVSSATKLGKDNPDDDRTTVYLDQDNDNTTLYEVHENDKPLISMHFGFNDCNKIDISSKSTNIKKVSVSLINNKVLVECEVMEGSDVSVLESEFDKIDQQEINPLKRSAVGITLEIKKLKLALDSASQNDKILILNTDAISQLSHVIIQPPNYKILKRSFRTKYDRNSKKPVSLWNNGISLQIHSQDRLKQTSLDCYFKKKFNVGDPNNSKSIKNTVKCDVSHSQNKCVNCDEPQEMSQISGTIATSHNIGEVSPSRSPTSRTQRNDGSNQRTRHHMQQRPDTFSAPVRKSSSPPNHVIQKNEVQRKRQDMKFVGSEASHMSPVSSKHNSGTSTPMATDLLQYAIPPKKKVRAKSIPDHKIIAGTHFAVDAFCYGDIPNVKHYFLSHFHSDHYAGLKRNFNKSLFCSKITADLCVSRLGVNPNCITVLKMDESVKIDGIEITAVDANHCPGAIMLLFTLTNGKSILHTGDFRATPVMESYPLFWNKDIHTIYLDTTYCNPRYDFPTQDQTMDMALYLLRQKKSEMEKNGKKFASVLIVCGTYTIGKEKFFLGMAQRIGCSVWACPEKDRVLQTVEGRTFTHAPSDACQLHVVPMRDITVEKLQAYLDAQQGAFNELVAFKPSGWENGKNFIAQRGSITIYGVPYSEHSSFSELVRFVNFLKPKQVIPTVEISGGVKAVQKFFSCPLVYKEQQVRSQSKMTDHFRVQNKDPGSAVTWLASELDSSDAAAPAA